MHKEEEEENKRWVSLGHRKQKEPRCQQTLRMVTTARGKFEWADHFQVVGDWFAFITRLLFFFCFFFSPVTIDARNFCFLLCVFVASLSETLQLRQAHSHVGCFTNARSRTQQSNESDKRRDNCLPCPWRNKEDQNSRFCHPQTNRFH